MTASSPYRAVLLMLASTVGVSAAHALVKGLATELPPIELVFFRNFSGLTVLIPVFTPKAWRSFTLPF